MNSNQKRLPFPFHLRQEPGAIMRTLGAAIHRWHRRLLGGASPANARRVRRQVRRWLSANGLTIVLVFAMMVVAWMVAER